MKRTLRTATGVALSSLIVLGLLFLIIRTTGEIRRLHERITEERVEIEARYFQRQKAGKTIENLSEVGKGLPTLRAITLERGNEIALVESIERIGDLNGVITRFRFIPPQGGPNDYSRKLALDLTVEGEAGSIGKFLSDLERIDPLIVITALSLQKGPKSGEVVAQLTGWVSWPEKLP